MKILHLEASTGWGGQEIRILREAEGMRQRGYEVILAVAQGGGLVGKAKEAGFTVHEVEFQKRYWPVTLFRLLRIMRGVDIVNTHSSLDSWIGGIAGRIAGKKILRTRHLSTPIKGGLNAKVLYGALADFVVTTCSSVRPHKRCRTVATGVDPAKIVAHKKVGTDFVVGTTCFMRSWKGIDDLLQAAHLLRDEKDLKWVIVGGGHAERHLRKAKELQLEGIVRFTGHLDNPFEEMSSMDVFALLSTAHEGISQALLQAAFLGKPLLTTRVGGLPEVCIDGVTGITVDSFAPEQVAKGVMKLKHSQEPFGKRAKELVEEKFLLVHTLDQMEEVYHLL